MKVRLSPKLLALSTRVNALGILTKARRSRKRMTESEFAAKQARIQTGNDAKEEKGSKFGNIKTVVNGIKFASGFEAKKYVDLCWDLKAGTIRNLRCQVTYVLAPSVHLGGPRKKPALRYIADFVYEVVATGETVVMDAKGHITPEYRIKKHLMATVHQILVIEAFAPPAKTRARKAA